MYILFELVPGIIILIIIVVVGFKLLRVIFKGLGRFFREVRHMDDFYRYGRWYDPDNVGLNDDTFYRNQSSGSGNRSSSGPSGSSSKTWYTYEDLKRDFKKEQEEKRRAEEERKRREQYEKRMREAEAKARMSPTEKAIRSAYESCSSRSSLDKQHKLLRKKYHPDNGGSQNDFVLADDLYEEYLKNIA